MSSPERKFLHDVSSPLTVALGHTDALLQKGGFAEAETKRLNKIMESLQKITTMIQNRRQELKSSEDSQV